MNLGASTPCEGKMGQVRESNLCHLLDHHCCLGCFVLPSWELESGRSMGA